ncbi:MAG: Uma2 family endonuclease [Chloroflexota bacterium]|nr:Uma2 family endonuclease [Chloroflexota bacterium]MDE2683702.1 Uma2 family endonuclease [Chloroflexota bacterium]
MTTVAKPEPVAAEPTAEQLPQPPLAGELRINLSALGIDAGAPDFAERFFEMANDNEPYTFEYSGNGELIVMPPAGWESNIGENETNTDLAIWRRENGGYACSQNVQFQLPGGAIYIPDAAWITQERYDALRTGEYASTIPGAPDFVVEVRSRTDRVAAGLAKMQEWMDGGSRLGWYIDPYERRVHVFRAGQDAEILDDPETLSGEDVLTGFVLEVRRLVFARYAELSDDGD